MGGVRVGIKTGFAHDGADITILKVGVVAWLGGRFGNKNTNWAVRRDLQVDGPVDDAHSGMDWVEQGVGQQFEFADDKVAGAFVKAEADVQFNRL